MSPCQISSADISVVVTGCDLRSKEKVRPDRARCQPGFPCHLWDMGLKPAAEVTLDVWCYHGGHVMLCTCVQISFAVRGIASHPSVRSSQTPSVSQVCEFASRASPHRCTA